MRARYVHRPGHPKASLFGMVDTRDLVVVEQTSKMAICAPIMVDRFYEGAFVDRMEPDKGSAKPVRYDVGSRKRHREYMKRYDLATADDFNKPGGYWERAAEEREQVSKGENDRKERREAIGKAMYEVEQKERRHKR